MKLTLGLMTATLLLAGPVFALPASDLIKSTLEKQTACESFVRFDDENLYLGQPQNAVKVVSLLEANTERTIATQSRAIDAVRIGKTLWVLTFQNLEEWNLESGERVATHETFKADFKMGNWQHPTGLAAYNDNLVIAHGIWGVSIFNANSRQLIAQKDLNLFQAPNVSMATGVTVAGSKAYLTMDDVTMKPATEKPAFRGIVIYDLETNTVEANLDKMDAGADSITNDGEKLIVSFMGMPIWKYGIQSLKGAQVPTPQQRVWLFGREGHPTGRASVDGKYYYSCFTNRDPKKSGRARYSNIPLALERKAIKLD